MTKTVFRVLGVVASFVVGGAAVAADAPAVEWKVSDGGNGHFYGYGRVQISDATFLQARDAAVLKGGHLPTVTSEAENTFVFQNIGGGLGLFRQPGGAWQNVTGEHLSRRIAPNECQDMQRLAQYIVRNPFSIAKMQVNRSGDSILYRSGMNAKIKRNFQVFSACDFIAAITQHIPDKRFQMVRYYG